MGVLKSFTKKGTKGVLIGGEIPLLFVCLSLNIVLFRQFRYNGDTNSEKERNLIFKKYPVMKLT
jgi:hypothetical protein